MKANIVKYRITVYKYSEKKSIMYGNVQRIFYVFTSTTYPQYLFLSLTDTYPDGSTKESLAYRNIPFDLEYYGNYIVTSDPQTLFYAGIVGMEN